MDGNFIVFKPILGNVYCVNYGTVLLKGYVILVIGFRQILWRPVKEVISNYIYNKV